MNDSRRLAALAEYRILDTPAEPSFDNLAQIAARAMRAPIALVSIVAEHRQWFKARLGIDVPETPREWSFCDHALRADATLVVPDATTDARFSTNPLVVGEPGIRFYCGVPLRTPDRQGLGTLCVMDRRPRTLDADERTLLEALGQQVELELEIRRRVSLLEDALVASREERQAGDLLTSMIVHDLRSPLAVVSALATTIATADAESRIDLAIIVSEAGRMRRMLTDVLDHSLHSLGRLRPRRSTFAVDDLAAEVVAKLGKLAPPGTAQLEVATSESPLLVDADPDLVGRVFENLIWNARQHAGPGPIAIHLTPVRGARIECEVCDRGQLIPEGDRVRVFEPFVRASSGGSGHGLGLSFCRLAIEAHGGRIWVGPNRSGPGNRFVFDLPAAAPDAAPGSVSTPGDR